MSDAAEDAKVKRPALPRATLRHQRATSTPAMPVVVTPECGDLNPTGGTALAGSEQRGADKDQGAAHKERMKPKAVAARNPFEGYGERTSSRPYYLRLPAAIDLVLRLIAAQERTHQMFAIRLQQLEIENGGMEALYPKTGSPAGPPTKCFAAS